MATSAPPGAPATAPVAPAAPSAPAGLTGAGAPGGGFADLERQTTASGSTEDVSVASSDLKRSGARARCGCPPRRPCACLAAAAAVLLTLCLVFRPRMATWELRALTFDHALLDGLAKAFTDPAFNSTLTLPMEVVVDVYNPNFIRVDAGAGHFRVTHGTALLAEVETRPGLVRAHGSSTVRATSTSTVTPEISKHLREVLPPAFAFSPDVRGELPVRVFGLVSLKIHLHCTVDVSVLAILSAPATMVTGQSCSRSIGL